MRLLLVEDNRRLQQTLRHSLVEAGYAVDVADNGEDGQLLGEMTAYDVMVLDVMLPKGDGLQVCRELRRRGVRVPILMLTARDTVADRVRGLDCGADDYLVKPFALDELMARIRALLRREMPHKEASYGWGTWSPIRRRSLSNERAAASSLPRRSTRSWSISCATRTMSSPANGWRSTSGVTTMRASPTWWMCTSAGCGGRSTILTPSNCSRPCVEPTGR